MSENNVQNISLDKVEEKPLGDIVVKEKFFSAVKDLELNLTVRLGKAKIKVDKLFELRENGILELDSKSSAPVDILLNGEVVAKGNIVVVG